MTFLQKVLPNGTAGIGVVQNPQDLNMLTHPECAGVIWQRDMPSPFQAWIDGLEPDHLPSTRMVVQTQDVRAAVLNACCDAGMENSAHRQHLINDIAGLVHRFRDIMDVSYMRLRLDRVTTNACRKFHVDAITARLVCTYRGTGTQYGTSREHADPDVIHTVPTGAPILLRGALWPQQTPTGVLHRSPPIEGSGETRLVLVLDPIFDLEDEM
ncbi:DUF1826 domain-containing protein [Ascidiaceihabitans sp.]|uniref:DUF1826 domain-containing protein n=1 Tax=Ascidiaceihabitans sp. TaxID=1872644 RepID=UPI0032999D00